MPEKLSAQDLIDLNEIRSKLPEGDPRIAKIDMLIGPSQQQKPTATIGAQPKTFQNWLQQLEGDIRYGGVVTTPGKILKFLGAPGINMGVSEGVADTVGGAFVGPVTTAQGVEQIPRDPWQGLMRTLEGVGQTTFPLTGIASPKGASLLGTATQKASHFLPGAAKRGGRLFQEVMEAASDVPVDMGKSGEVALRIQELVQRGSQMPQVVSKFLRRITDPDKGAVTYREARDFYSNISKLSADEAKRISPMVRGQLKQLRHAMNEAITEAAAKVQKGQEYVEALANYRGAGRMKETGKWLLKKGLPYGGVGYTIVDLLRDWQRR